MTRQQRRVWNSVVTELLCFEQEDIDEVVQQGWSTLSDLRRTLSIDSFAKMPLDANYFAITNLFRFIQVKAPTDRQLSKMTSDDYCHLDHLTIKRSYKRQYNDYAEHPLYLRIRHYETTYNGAPSYNDFGDTDLDHAVRDIFFRFGDPYATDTDDDGTTTKINNEGTTAKTANPRPTLCHIETSAPLASVQISDDDADIVPLVTPTQRTSTTQRVTTQPNNDIHVNRINRVSADEYDATNADTNNIDADARDDKNNDSNVDDNDEDNDVSGHDNAHDDANNRHNHSNDAYADDEADNNRSNNDHADHEQNDDNNAPDDDNNNEDDDDYHNDETNSNDDDNGQNDDDRSTNGNTYDDDSNNSSDDKNNNDTNENGIYNDEYDINDDMHNATSSSDTTPTDVATNTIITPTRYNMLQESFQIYENNTNHNFSESKNKNSNENFYENTNSDANFYDNNNDDNDTYGSQASDFYSDNDYYDDGYYDWGKISNGTLFQKHYLFLIIIPCHSQLVVPDYYISGYVLEIPPEPPPKLENIDKCVSTLLFHVQLILTNSKINDITFVIEIFWTGLNYLNMGGVL